MNKYLFHILILQILIPHYVTAQQLVKNPSFEGMFVHFYDTSSILTECEWVESVERGTVRYGDQESCINIFDSLNKGTNIYFRAKRNFNSDNTSRLILAGYNYSLLNNNWYGNYYIRSVSGNQIVEFSSYDESECNSYCELFLALRKPLVPNGYYVFSGYFNPLVFSFNNLPDCNLSFSVGTSNRKDSVAHSAGKAYFKACMQVDSMTRQKINNQWQRSVLSFEADSNDSLLSLSLLPLNNMRLKSAVDLVELFPARHLTTRYINICKDTKAELAISMDGKSYI